MASSTGKLTAYAAMALAYVFAGGSQLLFGAFLVCGSLGLVDLGGSEATVLGVDVCLCLVFFIQHSVMVRKGFRQRLARFVPAHYDAAFYAIVSGATLFFVIVCWQESAHTLAAPQGVVRWLFRAGFLLAIVGFVWGSRSLRGFDPFGIRHIRYHLRVLSTPECACRGKENEDVFLRGTSPRSLPFTVRGPYRWVRHPLYLFSLMLIWSCPDLTVDRLLFNLLWTAWMIAGAMLEERDLAEDLGDDYRTYQRQVPMLIPWRLRPMSGTDAPLA